MLLCLMRSHNVPIGEVFGRSTVLSAVESPGKRRVLCRCDCGTSFEVLLASLKSGNTVSCGCAALAERTKHGMHKSPEYSAWAAMIQRCSNPKSQEWKNYGGRGIEVCKDWRESFLAFFEHVGKRPSVRHSLDRFPDHNGNYELGNVRWATPTQQSRNTRKNIVISIGGKSRVLADAAEELGISTINARNRRDLGWSDDRLLTPVKVRGPYRKRAR